MPIFLASLLGGLLSIVGSLVGRVVLALGFAAVAYTGISSSLDFLKDSAVSALLGLPPDVVGLMGVMKVGQSVSIIFSAITARLLLNGLSSDTVKRWVMR